MRPRFCLLFLVLFAASAATATPELISWRQNDIANIIGWRLYVQHDGDPLASIIEVPVDQNVAPDGLYAHFIERNLGLDMWVTVVALDTDGNESDAAWTKTYPAHDKWTPCQLDLDSSGAVGGGDWQIFVNLFGQYCTP